jgi:probable phosphoglycerate mutase
LIFHRFLVSGPQHSRTTQGNVGGEPMPSGAKQIWLVRHAETEWSASGRHTGRSDIPLTPTGIARAKDLAPALAVEQFDLVLSSPRSRALETARCAGFGATVAVEEALAEWDYGDYEGLTSSEIAARCPGWDLWRAGCPNGEGVDAVAARAKRVIDRCLASPRNALLFSHGHYTRMIAAVWLELAPTRGRSFGLKAGSISVLGFEHENRVIWQWDRVNAFEGH